MNEITTKIKYRLVYNYAGHINNQGKAPVSLECRQGKQKMYISSQVMLEPHQWYKGRVIEHDNADKLTVFLIRWTNQVEEIELDQILSGNQITLLQLKEAVKSGVRSNATLREFTEAVIETDSSRCLNTKRSYRYLVNEMEKEYGNRTLNDVTYDLVIRYRESMRKKQLSENTIKGRLKALRCIMEQARIRDLIRKNPFEQITIGNIGGRVGGLTMNEVKRLERLKLTGKEEKVRDLFILGCTTGLRWGDLSTLEQAEIRNGILTKTMHKTHHDVVLPISSLFYGKPMQIINKYPDITELSHVCCNTQANKILKDLAARANIKKRCYFHLSRKTFSQLLNEIGMDIGDISLLMGHRETRTTLTHYVFNNDVRMKKSVKKLFKTKST